jgi:hypothetical protein
VVGRHQAAMGLLATGLVTTACGSSLPPRATLTPASVESPTTIGRLHSQSLAAITRTAQVHSLWVWGTGRFVAWTEGPSQTPMIVLYDRISGQTRTVLRGATASTNLYPVRGEGSTMVVLEEPSVPNDALPTTTWQIVTVDATTGRVALVRKSPRPTPGEIVPYPEFDGRWIVWEEPQGDTADTTDLMSFDTRTGRTVTLANHVPYAGPSVQNGVVYYRQERAGSADIFRVAADGSKPAVQLTHTGVVGGIVARNGGLAWNQPPTGDKRSIWYLPDGGATPVELASQGDRGFPGRGFVVYALPPDNGQLLAVSTSRAGGDPLTLSDSFPGNFAGWSVDGNVVVWAEPQPGGQSTVIHVAQVGTS